ncbi:MAG: histidine kinase [Saprospiraceae bacterium]|nr:histidine kinase [Saprospiraceae bacterium]
MKKWLIGFVLLVFFGVAFGQEADLSVVQENIERYKAIKYANHPRGFASWIQGILFILCAYHLLAFFENRNKAYLFYSLYVFCFLLYFSFSNFHLFYSGLTQPLNEYLFYPIQFFGYAAYIAFGQQVINTKKVVPEWHRFMNYGIRITLAMGVTFFLIQLMGLSTSTLTLFSILLFPTSLIAVGTYVVLAAKLKYKHVFFFVSGSFIYFILAYVALFYSLQGTAGKYTFSFTPLVFMQIGAVIESLMFALLVGYQQRKDRLARENVELALAKQAQQATELQLKALRAQMNPHFIFNSLNSINHFIIKEDAEQASDYLTKFSKLIRQTLEYSNQNTISLEAEVKHLSLYIKLEQIRMKSSFDYIQDIDPALNLSSISIPPLVLQPFVENAIWHGLNPKTSENKRLLLSIQPSESGIDIYIEDNGVGRVAASQQPKLRRSFGTQITKERMNTYQPDGLVAIEFIDLEDAKGPAGTRVIVRLKSE